ncbi:Permease of the drug/metabolite transporter (DMT) superfamily [Ferrimonas sediminum]|uniref:Permease of the drug/metabolite transporter (DMT) superfamily n=1 Tax=Ferrimonas sediminum TaxID=718193 RepID=A0A1G8TVN8_9GAMM|nr:DMT family transporter [Ferrimonas sediminum]SDJ45636.1 Permease of the drug/metabolite transporter (DMT) superfamily [Ferrimonas sediminum]
MARASVVPLALGLLVLGNLLASVSDVAVKLLEGGISPYQYIFIRQVLATLLVTPWLLRLPKGRRHLHSPGITLIRAQLVLVGSGCMMVAVTYLPLATANALFYAAPLLMLPLSLWLLKERPPWTRVLATGIGFVGVLVVLRPQQFHWAALFALGTATTLALFHVLVRRLPQRQPVANTVFWTNLLCLPLAAPLALLNWQPVSVAELGWVALSAVCISGYNGLAVLAYRRAPSAQIALAEYSGLLFVTLFGVWWFAEVPDGLTLLGIGLILLPMLPLRRLPLWQRLAPMRK